MTELREISIEPIIPATIARVLVYTDEREYSVEIQQSGSYRIYDQRGNEYDPVGDAESVAETIEDNLDYILNILENYENARQNNTRG